MGLTDLIWKTNYHTHLVYLGAELGQGKASVILKFEYGAAGL